MIEGFKDELKGFQNILNEIKKKLKLLREQEINETKNETKRKLNMQRNEINDTLEKLDLMTLIRCRFCEKPHDFEKERKLRLSAKKE